MKKEAVQFKDKIILDSGRENLHPKIGVEHCVMPILIGRESREHRSGSVVQHAVVRRDHKWLGEDTKVHRK